MSKDLVLGIESSCDETSVAVVEDAYRVLSNETATQMDLHEKYGGVVPEVASRRHLESLPFLVKTALERAQARYEDLSGIAVTSAPGLIGALLVGFSAAKGLALRLGIPFIPVHHVEAHLYAVRLDSDPIEFPALGLVVSGGHTEIYQIESWGNYQRLAATRDDAAGEAFDKVAKLLGLAYPGGPALEKLAKNSPQTPGLFSLSKMKDGSQDFSFSGVKTAVALDIRKNPPKNDQEKAALASKFQNTVLAEIQLRVRRALVSLRPKSFLMGGGVACNQGLRDVLKKEAESVKAVFRVPPLKFCSDNAAMVAGLGAYRLSEGKFAALSANASASPSCASPFLLQ